MSKHVVEIIHVRMPDDIYSCKHLNYNGVEENVLSVIRPGIWKAYS